MPGRAAHGTALVKSRQAPLTSFAKGSMIGLNTRRQSRVNQNHHKRHW